METAKYDPCKIRSILRERDYLYIAVEGPDGCGKGTLVKQLVALLQAEHGLVYQFREPGSTPVGEAVRALLLDRSLAMEPATQLTLFTAVRCEAVRRFVVPALAEDKFVLSDRCWLSTFAYQSIAEINPPVQEWAAAMTKLRALQENFVGRLPDVYLVLDVDNAIAERRVAFRDACPGAAQKPVDRFTRWGTPYFNLLRRAYQAMPLLLPDRPVHYRDVSEDTPEQTLDWSVRVLTGQ
jgi:dTMP kinase